MACENVSFFEARKAVNKQTYAQAVMGRENSGHSQDFSSQGIQAKQFKSNIKKLVEEDQLDTVAGEIAAARLSPTILKKLINVLIRTLNQMPPSDDGSTQRGH